jgi:quercetin dioxygenase-like cupin family protein
MPETIDLGSLKLRFLQSKDDTAGSIDMFEMTVQPNARMPIPHYHDRWDETIYGLTGTTTWRVDGNDIDLGPGETVFIKRGIVHGFTNRTAEPATCLCTLSPGVLGPQYFKDMAGLLAAGAPDPASEIRADTGATLLRRKRPQCRGDSTEAASAYLCRLRPAQP